MDTYRAFLTDYKETTTGTPHSLAIPMGLQEVLAAVCGRGLWLR